MTRSASAYTPVGALLALSGMSQRALARKLGLPQQQVQRWASGSPMTVTSLLRVFWLWESAGMGYPSVEIEADGTCTARIAEEEP